MVQFSKAYWAVIGLMALTFAAKLWLQEPPSHTTHDRKLQQFPTEITGWVAQENPLDEKITRALRLDQSLRQNYTRSDGKKLELFVGYYRDQKFGAQVHSPQHCLPGSGWTILRYDKFKLPFADASFANQLHINKNEVDQFVIYWFASGGELVQTEWALKLRLLLNAFQHRPTEVYFYRLCMPFVAGEEAAALRSVTEFMQATKTSFQSIARI